MDPAITNYVLDNWGVLATGVTVVATVIFPPTSIVAKALPTGLKILHICAEALRDFQFKKKNK